MKIAIIAWGSLLWDPRTLKLANEFSPSGPTLPIEFSRVSGRDGSPLRLTLVLDEEHGTPCCTHVAESSYRSLNLAKENLRFREGMHHVNGVGYVIKQSEDTSFRAQERHPEAVAIIRAWLADSDYDAVIWTALASNFDERTGEPFSEKAALEFLSQQQQEHLAASLEYIRKAPAAISTPVRLAVSDHWPD
ncbi:hypothetical protein [Pseudovibrio sp. POLY-S9]|uniref:hypothetical protein n=1 Tax=Pseudovibrio sp. POLY-S9 TaxID=1576596 RepID=UPI000708E4D0|nr:hypothetical protein [Pseudovibrio sp. POLY-S9]